MLDIMPSKGLVIHQWRKHGTCSGLGQDGYFEATREAFESLRIPDSYISPTRSIVTTPDDLEQDFLTANPALDPTMFTVHCGNRRDRANLVEVRLCFDRNLNPRACGYESRRTCRADSLVLPPVR